MPYRDRGGRRMQARKAALTRHARTPPSSATTAAARAAFEQRFQDAALDSLPPDAPWEQIQRTTAYFRRLYFMDLAERSAKARQRKAAKAK